MSRIPAAVLLLVLMVPSALWAGPLNFVYYSEYEPPPLDFLPIKTQYFGEHESMAVHLLLRVNDAPATNADATVPFDADCELGPVVLLDGLAYSGFTHIRINNTSIPTDKIRPLEQLPGLLQIHWATVEARDPSYTNSNNTPGWWADIQYRENMLSLRTGDPTIHGSRKPLLRSGITWNGVHVGTLRYKAILEFQDHYLSTPGAEAVQKAGLLPGVRRISRMGGSPSPVVNHALALANLPYIWGSASRKGAAYPKYHQAELYIGADCADLVTAAWRMAGLTNEQYSGALPLLNDHQNSPRLTRIQNLDSDNLYRTPHNATISIGPTGQARIGAAIIWSFSDQKLGHTAILAQDSGPEGIPNALLDIHDIVIHTNWSPPETRLLGSIGFGLVPVAVLNPPE